MKDTDIFQTLIPLHHGTFSEQLQELKVLLREWMMKCGLTPAALVQTRVYLSDAANQWEEFLSGSLYSCYLSAGAVSYIEQPLLDGSKVALQLWFSQCPDLRKTGTPDCCTVTGGGMRALFHSVRFRADEVCGLNAEEQTVEAFRRHMDLLRERGMSLKDNCHRTWIYVRDVDRHYSGVVSGRNRIFAEEGLTADTHYIASTGIGGYPDNREAVVSIDFLSLDGEGVKDVKYLHAPEYLNPTHEYGVAFERGTSLTLPGGRFSFISGTASIDRYGQCLHAGDVLTQAGRLFLNIEKLLNADGAALSDMKYMIVYLRDISDYSSVAQYLALRFPDVPLLITEARVCRPEWLIEVEGVAVRPNGKMQLNEGCDDEIG